MGDKHFHSCPQCYQRAPCALACPIGANLSEGWNEAAQEFARPFGATTECDACLKNQEPRRITLTLAADTTVTECGGCPAQSLNQCGAYGLKPREYDRESGKFKRLPECIAAETQ